MRIPKRDTGSWCNEVIGRCNASREKRILRGAMYRNVYLTGDKDGNPQVFNKTQLFIDRQSSWTYSPAALRYAMDADGDVTPTERAMGKRAIAELHKRIRRGGVDRAAKEAVKWSRIKGKAFTKLLWTGAGFEPTVLQPEVLGVEREDLNTLEQQKAFTHTSWYTIDGFVNLVATHPAAERDKLIRKAAQLAKASNLRDKPDHSAMKQILMGGMYPYKDGSANGQAGAGQQAQVDWLGGPQPTLAPELAARMLEVNELWVWDDERDDWTTFQMLADAGDDAFIFGMDQHINLFADAFDPARSKSDKLKDTSNPLAGMLPFVEFCPNPLDGYFWGMSDVARVALLQRGINRRIDGINQILRRQENPSRSYIGFSGVNQNTNARLNKPGGWISESAPNAKIQDVQPELPRGLWESLDKLIQYFDDVGGVTPTMGGQGDAGIRSDVHANTLLKTATASIKDQAIEIERSVSELGNLGLQILKAQDPTMLTAYIRKNEADVESAAAAPTSVDGVPVEDLVPVDFLLNMLPEHMYVSVDCHSSSPIFAEEQQVLLFELKKLGALSNQQLIEGIHPPREQAILDDLERHDVQQAKMIAQHPELLTKGKHK